MFSRWLRGGGAVAFTVTSSLVFGMTTVAAKAPDTPDYLLPFYLRSARARFNHYASIREKGGLRFMTADDFVAAMLAAKDPSIVTPAAVEELAKLFADADANHDGRISFREFSFLSILLCTKMEDFERAFTMFDEEQKGGLTKAQFKKMISVFGDESMKPTMKSGLVEHIFDTNRFADGSATSVDKLASRREPIATLQRFKAVIGDLERSVRVAEFRLADTEKKGRISRREFGELLTNSILGRHLPFFLVDNLRRMDESDSGPLAVTLDSWLVLNEMMKNSDAITEAMRMYAANGQPVRRPEFHRAVHAVGNLSRKMTSGEVDLVFEIFDRDGDGTLEEDEFAAVMRGKASYNVIEPEKTRNNFFVQLVKCGRRVADGGLGDAAEL
jgi:Ca2+-binding EF-hand superfamily protein